ncbi:hypothetical protein BYT27DRAFT_7140644 [Phlegmacium glaucopus]|nr:hypothetical protein BYT27DRAFT_7140644 [Phlegmacium glaucopus]
MSATTGRLIFVFLLVVNCILWSRSRYGQPIHVSLLESDTGASLVKRISYELSQPQGTDVHFNSSHEASCRPRAYSPTSQCQHVQVDCPRPNNLLGIDHLHHYFCTDISLRPLVFVGLILWLIFLFSTLGISASDFFTPNLATIAQLLGLDENVAGVTFLAFGNGSPDVFSTFSAMHANSGSLAIGELLGAATFIVSCVVGSMCIIKPFKVHRTPFLRDVGFFTVAVILMLMTLWDGKIDQREAGALVVMYVVYVVVVVVSSWWERRQERKRHMDALIRAEYAEEPHFQPYTDRPVPSVAVTPPTPGLYASSTTMTPRLQITIPPQTMPRSPSPTSPYVAQLPSFSILGALEFREVVASLKKEAAGTSLSYFESPIASYAGGHYHARNHAGVRSQSQSQQSSLSSSIDDTTLNRLRLDDRLRPQGAQPIHEERQSADAPNDYLNARQNYQLQVAPSIYRIPPSPSATISDAESDEQLYIPLTKRQRMRASLGNAYHILFPTLHNFRQQSLLTQIASVLAAPAVLCLTVTLPVVVTPYNNAHASHEKIYGDARLVDFEEEGIERALIAEQEVEENMHELSFSKWLTAVQCVLGPSFCVQVLFGGTRFAPWLWIVTLIAGLAVGTLVIIFADTGLCVAGRMTRCSMGFLVSIVWIMAIADEVVNVLQTFGLIFGLSDAIIGLTIFAVGNSLADLVANMSVAVFAPIMGFSACFGGPMLNILLGVGVSGSYLIHQTSEPYVLKLSNTLFVSCFGLLFLLAATLFFVPFNDYFLSRRWGILLITTYTIIMMINVIVELKS